MNHFSFIENFISLLSLINPISALPVYISLTDSHEDQWKKYQLRKTSLYILIICCVSYYAGSYILNFFGISINALSIAGGIIISRSGFLLLNTKHKGDISKAIKKESLSKEDISFSPLAMPLLAGPGSMAYLINSSMKEFSLEKNTVMIFVFLAISVTIYALFSLAPAIIQKMGKAGITSLSKIMGFIVLAIGIQMITNSVLDLFQHLLK
jgi:multiple antibiotic resistance protein